MWLLFRSGRGSQSTPSGTSTPAWTRSSRLWSVRRPNNGICSQLLQTTQVPTPLPPLWTTRKQTTFSWSPRSVFPPAKSRVIFFSCSLKWSSSCSRYTFKASTMLELFSRAWCLTCLSQRGLAPWLLDLKGWPRADMLKRAIVKNWTRQEILTCAQISTSRNFLGWPSYCCKIFTSRFNTSNTVAWYYIHD